MKNILKSLRLDRGAAIAAGTTAGILVLAFLIFNNLTVPYARHWDIEWGYISILVTFILLVVGAVVNIPYIVKNGKSFLPSGKPNLPSP